MKNKTNNVDIDEVLTGIETVRTIMLMSGFPSKTVLANCFDKNNKVDSFVLEIFARLDFPETTTLFNIRKEILEAVSHRLRKVGSKIK